MGTTLYRKYRPKVFGELVGQRHIAVTLSREIESGRLAHAYLFTGPRGVGKTTVARLLAKAINCTGRKGAEPDNTCGACLEMTDGRSLDLLEVDAASQTGVDNVRENIIANARVAPSRLKYKVFIIDEVHMLSIGAFNALLKLLEEPPAHALFILATTEVHKVPETIISRCQRFDFHRVSVEDLKARLATLARLESVDVDDDVLEDLARRAEGSVRDADSLLGQLVALGEKHITSDVAGVALPRTNIQSVLDFFIFFVRRDRAGAISKLHELVEDGVSLPHFVRQFIELIRALVLLKVNPLFDRGAVLALDAKQEQAVLELLPSISLDDLIRLLEAFHDLDRQVKTDAIPQLPVELAIVKVISGGVESVVAPPPLAPVKTSTSAKKVKAEPKRPPPAAEASESVVDVSSVEKVWGRIVEAVKQVNHGIAVLLKTAAPVDVKSNCLVIGVRFPFHAERLMENKNRRQLEDVLSEILKTRVTIRCSVVPKSETADDAAVGDIAKAFGGEVL